jgi:hypothetical protein
MAQRRRSVAVVTVTAEWASGGEATGVGYVAVLMDVTDGKWLSCEWWIPTNGDPAMRWRYPRGNSEPEFTGKRPISHFALLREARMGS